MTQDDPYYKWRKLDATERELFGRYLKKSYRATDIICNIWIMLGVAGTVTCLTNTIVLVAKSPEGRLLTAISGTVSAAFMFFMGIVFGLWLKRVGTKPELKPVSDGTAMVSRVPVRGRHTHRGRYYVTVSYMAHNTMFNGTVMTDKRNYDMADAGSDMLLISYGDRFATSLMDAYGTDFFERLAHEEKNAVFNREVDNG